MKTTLVAALLCALASSAQAQDAGSIHLDLEASVLSWDASYVDEDDIAARRVFGVEFPGAAGLRAGYLPLEMLEVGALASLRFQDFGDRGDEYSQGVYGFMAYARYVAPGKGVRLFAGPFLGGQFSRFDDPGEGSDESFEATSRELVVGLDVGLYGFVAKSLSIDPVLSVLYRNGSEKFSDDFGDRYDTYGVRVTLGLAISAWIPTR